MIDFNNPNLESYRKQLRKICEQLDHWRFLTTEEKLKFTMTQDREELERLMTTARVKAWEINISQPTNCGKVYITV